MNKLMQVRKEYGEPFTAVVRGFAEMGYSRRAVAGILGFNLSYFRQLLNRFNLHRHFLPQSEMREECKGKGAGWPPGKERHREKFYSDEQLLNEVRRLPSYSMARAIGDIHPATVQNRFGSWTRARELAGVPAN